MTKMLWKIEIHKHGILLYGFCRVTEVCEIAKMTKMLYGFDLLDCSGVADRFGANFAFVSQKSQKLWCKELGIEKDQKE